MKLEHYIRFLAKSLYWQEIYRSSKECNGIHLFRNVSDISGLQYLFLYWLRVYNFLYSELANSMWSNLDVDVIKDYERCDAFLYWRQKEIEKENREHKKQQKKANRKKGTRDFKMYKGQGK